ncbi:MAG: hypothetical protein OZ923_03195 [Comamonadaceae bacterium]|nr:hypothetical protein [Burkholderiales bacterium]MEB2347595.1 hypothetical protein [Comamonadaceae bacterium]
MPTTLHSSETRRATIESTQFPPLEHVTRPLIPTGQAAHYLLRQCQTLRGWACFENGPIRPVRIGNRLGWPVDEIRRLLGVQ